LHCARVSGVFSLFLPLDRARLPDQFVASLIATAKILMRLNCG